MRRAAFVAFVVLVLTFSSTHVQAQVVKGSWAKLDGQPAGTRIVVRLRKGTRINCTFLRTSENELFVTVPSAGETTIAKGNVAEVTKEEKQKDSLKNGAAWGLG